jgi:hypothetical protein
VADTQLDRLLASQYLDLRTFRETIRGHSKHACYVTPPTAVAAPQATPAPNSRFAIRPSAHFFAQGIVGAAMQGAGAAIPNAHLQFLNTFLGTAPTSGPHAVPSVQLTDEASSQTLFQRAMFWTSVVGTAEEPMPLVPARFFRAGSGVRAEFFMTAGAVAFSLQIGFLGYEVFLV